jgi:hypothetical protein
MELENRTPFPAALVRAILDERRLAAAVVARVTYAVAKGKATPAEEQAWKVSLKPWDSEHGPMESDEIFYRGGVDLLLFGTARAKGGKPFATHEVSIEAGKFARKVAVFGKRHWEGSFFKVVPSAPQPVAAVPLTLAHAYGGKDKWDGLDVPYPDNPEGKGFYLDAKAALGNPLPDLEEPDRLIAKWDDRPEPAGVGLCPIHNGLRVRNGLEFDPKSHLLKTLKPAYFNQAFPRMICPALKAGDAVKVSGVLESGSFQFELPRTDLVARLRFGDEVDECPLVIDQVGIEPDRSRAFVTYRYPFRYVLRPLTVRSCELFWKLPEAGETARRERTTKRRERGTTVRARGTTMRRKKPS